MKAGIKKENQERKSLILNGNTDLTTLLRAGLMSANCYNVCMDAGLTSLKLIFQYYSLNKKNSFQSLRYCGEITNKKLINLCLQYEHSVNSIQEVKVNDNPPMSPVDSFLDSLILTSADYQKVKNSISGLNYIPLFKILDLLIDSHFVFQRERHTQVFKSTFNCYLPPTNYSLAEAGKEFGLTSERVRQLHEAVYKKIQHSFWFVKTGESKNIFPEYLKLVDQPIIFISDEDVNRINQNENTHFSQPFIAFILSELLLDRFTWVGDLKTLLSNSTFRKKSFVKHLYLVNRTIASQFQFDPFLNYLESLGCQGCKEDEFMPLGQLIERFKMKDASDDLAIMEAVKTIVINEFKLFTGTKEDQQIFYRNRKRTLASHIIEILENSDKPLHYSKIHQELVLRGAKTKSEQSTHGCLFNKSEIFGLKGQGIFDLRSKGGLFGTIGDVAEQILTKRNAPVHIHILEHLICRELMVSKKSIRPILFSYRSENRFIRDKSGNVSLKKW